MPVDEYDYSHFEYLNQKFESEFKETVKFAEENYDYEEYEDEDEAEKIENSILIKKLRGRVFFIKLRDSIIPSLDDLCYVLHLEVLLSF